MAIALSIAEDYARWLNTELDASLAEVASLRDELTRVRETASGMENDLRPRAEQAEILAHRLQDLEHRGPIGLIKWKIGALVLQRRSR
ncbi:hypothetical protein E3T43_11175 [Cryobacterium sp. Hh7]|uniref:hypothetical protein n=1 Tax=Cryobacterium sp. Hh7 TaxID=1259159 RepID=UPI001102F570|nr:hypothetical protein [Cryobacterium sp. Hh7]TFD55490.1 hypothetical protein E3T43_11175 [Cryobacterium sp. Hh7]